jgi:phospholipase C
MCRQLRRLARPLALASIRSLVVVLAGAASCTAQGSNTAQATPVGFDKINHVIWIIQENRSFDNYFGTYPGADGLPPATCLPVLPESKQCVEPFHMPKGQTVYDLNHDWETIHAAYDHGRMDGFVWAEGSSFTMGYYDERDIPNYWNYAHHFTLCDHFRPVPNLERESC